jgi:pyruvate,orthophosphate dikinase
MHATRCAWASPSRSLRIANRAIFNAAARLTKEAQSPPEFEIPLTIDINELKFFKTASTPSPPSHGAPKYFPLHLRPMIELRGPPSSRRTRDVSDFFSFGTKPHPTPSASAATTPKAHSSTTTSTKDPQGKTLQRYRPQSAQAHEMLSKAGAKPRPTSHRHLREHGGEPNPSYLCHMIRPRTS